MTNKLAIVIPAYKAEFFKATLESIASQTCQDFTLYIGNDASPHNLAAIVKEYEGRIDIVYENFTNNLGGTDLVAHWARCVSLTKDEEWIWLFSDDDIMDVDCVENFFKYIKENSKVGLLHFDIDIINNIGEAIKHCNPFPKQLSIIDFFSKRIKFKINTTVVEYIFRKEKYYQEGGFKNYDLGWCADDATWIKFGKHAGIATIPVSKVKFRYSGSNISSNLFDKEIILRKLESSISHIKWIKNYFIENNLVDSTTQFEKMKWVISVVVLTRAYSFKEKYKLVLKVADNLDYNVSLPIVSLYLIYWQIRHCCRIF